MSEKDIIRDVLERLMEHEPSITEEMALQIERDVRKHWGGERVYIRADVNREPHVRERIMRDALTTATTAEIQKRHGISRSTIYRLLKRPKVDA